MSMSECRQFRSTLSRGLFVLLIALFTSGVTLGDSDRANAQNEQYNQSVSPTDEEILQVLYQAFNDGMNLISPCVADDLDSCEQLFKIQRILDSFCNEGYQPACSFSESITRTYWVKLTWR